MKTETSISFLARTARRLADATVARTATQARTAAERLGVTLILALLTTATAWAQTSQPHAIYCDANKTLYFAYGVKDEMFTETPDPDDETNTILKFTPEGSSEEVTVTEWYTGGSVISSDKPAWSSDLMGSVSSVVFESSFASVRPTALNRWFSGFGALTSIQGLENLNTSEVTTMAYMFQNCASLTSLDLRSFDTSKVTNMKQMFHNCKNLTSIVFGNGWNTPLLTSADLMFWNCTSLKSVTLPEGMTIVGWNAFLGCSNLTDITIPHTITTIDEKAFLNCTSLMSVYILDGIVNIGAHAFQNCTALTSICIPSTVESIGQEAFGGCSALASVYCMPATPPQKGGNEFWGNASGRKIYVSADSEEAYKTSWSDYSGDIVSKTLHTITVNVTEESFGTVALSTAHAANGNKVQLKANPNAGYHFVWWEVTKGGVTVANPSAELTTLTMPDKDVTVNAKFRGNSDNPNTYNLTLDLNDGTAQMESGIKTYTLTSRVRSGYLFLGWATSATGEPVFKAGDTVTLEGNLTLYAIWLQMPVELANEGANAATLAMLKDYGTPVDVKLSNRSLVKDGYWNTLCLPFGVTDGDDTDDITFTGTPLAGATLMELDVESAHDGHMTDFDATDGTLYLFFKAATAIEAGKPYIIKWGTPDPSAAVDVIQHPTFTGVTITTNGATTIASEDGTVSFHGTYNTLSIPGENRSILFLGDGNTLYYPNAAMSINAFRTYFELNGITAGDTSAGVRSFVLNFGDNETAIKSLSVDAKDFSDGGAWYTLDGRRLSGKPAKSGIYVNGRRKVVIK